MNHFYGITGIMVKPFNALLETDILNHFLTEYDGNILDIQYGANGSVLVIYKAMEE